MTLFRCLVLACSLLASQAHADDGGLFKVRVNPLQGILDLAYSYCGGPYESVALQRALESAGHRSGEAPEAIVRFCTTDIHRNGTGFPGRPPLYDTGRPHPWHRFTRASVTSPDMATFADETAGVFSFEEQRAVLDAMREMAPLYETLIEAPFGAQARAKGEALSDYLESNDVQSMLHRIAGLYAVPWPEDLPLWIGLSPTPPGGPGFSATIEGNVVRSFMPVDYDRLEVYAGIMAHEYAHVLFSNFPMETVRRIQAAFADAGSPSRRFAEVWMNEALATAAGNGWVHWRLAGEANPGEWYSDPVVDAYAKAISPSVHAALESGATIDAPLIGAFVEAFDRALPQARDDPAVVLPHAVLVADADAASQAALGAAYRKRVQTRRLDIESPTAGGYVPGAWLPTVLRVEIMESEVSAPVWRRRILDDGGLEYSVRISGVEAFGGALEALIARIAGADW